MEPQPPPGSPNRLSSTTGFTSSVPFTPASKFYAFTPGSHFGPSEVYSPKEDEDDLNAWTTKPKQPSALSAPLPGRAKPLPVLGNRAVIDKLSRDVMEEKLKFQRALNDLREAQNQMVTIQAILARELNQVHHQVESQVVTAEAVAAPQGAVRDESVENCKNKLLEVVPQIGIFESSYLELLPSLQDMIAHLKMLAKDVNDSLSQIAEAKDHTRYMDVALDIPIEAYKLFSKTEDLSKLADFHLLGYEEVTDSIYEKWRGDLRELQQLKTQLLNLRPGSHLSYVHFAVHQLTESITRSEEDQNRTSFVISDDQEKQRVSSVIKAQNEANKKRCEELRNTLVQCWNCALQRIALLEVKFELLTDTRLSFANYTLLGTKISILSDKVVAIRRVFRNKNVNLVDPHIELKEHYDHHLQELQEIFSEYKKLKAHFIQKKKDYKLAIRSFTPHQTMTELHNYAETPQFPKEIVTKGVKDLLTKLIEEYKGCFTVMDTWEKLFDDRSYNVVTDIEREDWVVANRSTFPGDRMYRGNIASYGYRAARNLWAETIKPPETPLQS